VNGELFKNLLWLRWRLMANQSRRSLGGRLGVVLTVIALVGAVVLALGGCVGGILVGYLVPHLHLDSASTVLKGFYLLAGAFLFFWFVGLLSEVQRSETIDIGRLLHLPVDLRDVFVLNYLVSIFSLSVVLVVPAMIGLAGGLVRSCGPAMLLLFPLVLSFVFMITAWVYCLRGWLVALMRNERRRRVVIATMTVLLVLGCQIPNLIVQFTLPSPGHGVPGREAGAAGMSGSIRRAAIFAVAHGTLPPLWLPYGAVALGEGRYWPAAWGSLGGFLIGWLGLHRAYRSTLRFYQGVSDAKPGRAAGAVAVARAGPAAAPRSRTRLVEWRLPGVPDEVAAGALACFRSLTRAPEVKMALIMNLVMPFIMVLLLSRHDRPTTASGQELKPFMATGAVAAAVVFGAWGLLINQFGFDRDGFRSYVLLPVERHLILLGKNLAALPFCFGFNLLFLAVATGIFRLPPGAVVAACFQIAAIIAVFMTLGNLTSILVPYRFAPGSLKPTKMETIPRIVLIVAAVFGPLFAAPIFVPPALGMLCSRMEWLPGVPVNLIASVALAGVCVLTYALVLRPLGRLLQRRERDILSAVTTEVE